MLYILYSDQYNSTIYHVLKVSVATKNFLNLTLNSTKPICFSKVLCLTFDINSSLFFVIREFLTASKMFNCSSLLPLLKAGLSKIKICLAPKWLFFKHMHLF